ncbi:Phospho-2-dehydro-3-deoxyheptonate aldolase [Grifola frondosa]|uniref:Phospho-2-dehydro-3-deoxyheptonate aldolase n=1 Tax=Grifola frondosa TaxID=5627 RepID=A0A1C7M1R7_GRIFR|nr:Phospho-2-dehydro-3-deoxyheptonate aldolase [Grifola frondosa]
MSGSRNWTLSSWRSKPAAQIDRYLISHISICRTSSTQTVVLSKIRTLPPLVTPSEIQRLRYQLSQVQRNQAFLLHAGDCAESFDACTHENISAKIGLILSFSLILIWGARMPVVRIGRIAGQYAKPRSNPTEKIGDREVFSFRLDPNDRSPDPERLLSAYFHSTTTLNYIRGLLTSGFASLHHPRDWSLTHVRSPALREEFERITEGLSDALGFTRTIGFGQDSASYENGGGRGTLGEVEFYTSHEGLMLEFEEAMTREFPIPSSLASTSRSLVGNADPSTPKVHYNTSAHFLWIGDRTRQLNGAHVEYFRGIRNPIGIKVGPSMAAEELVRLLDIVNPDREDGKVTLITRYGAGKVETHLAGHIAAVQKSRHPVIWISDPMHGNTLTSSGGLKTRNFGTIISELTACIRIHSECGSHLNGVSLEFTGELNDEGFSVTECLGGSMGLSEEQLGLRYQSFCDPRLNFEQSLDVAFLISDHFKKERMGAKRSYYDVLYSELGGRKASAYHLPTHPLKCPTSTTAIPAMASQEQEPAAVQPTPPVQVLYCEVCTFPPEYCEFGSSITRCKEWLLKEHPDLHEKYYSEEALQAKLGTLSLEAQSKLEKDTAKKEAKAEAKADALLKKKMITLRRIERNKRKHVTAIHGLEAFDVDLKKAAKFFAQKFATGASVTKNPQGLDEIVVQGDVSDDILDMIEEGVGLLKGVPKDNVVQVEEKKKKGGGDAS